MPRAKTRKAADCGAQRTLRFYGHLDARSEFLRLASEAAVLVRGIPQEALPVACDPILVETREAYPGSLCLWTVWLFELSWAEIPTSRLRASPKTVWEGGTTFDLAEVPQLPAVYRDAIPDPPCWYSLLDDVFSASAYALDVLLHSLPTKVEPGGGEGGGARTPKTRRRRKRKPDPKAEERRRENDERRKREKAISDDWDKGEWETFEDYATWKNQYLPTGWDSLDKVDVLHARQNVKGRKKRTRQEPKGKG